MDDSRLFYGISRIVNEQPELPRAVEKIVDLLERQAGIRALITEDVELGKRRLEDFGLACSWIEEVILWADGRELGRFRLGLASDSDLGTLPKELASFLGQQVGMLARRLELQAESAALRREIARIDQEIMTRKVVARAEGILIDRHRLSPEDARRWFEAQTVKTGLTQHEVADRIITLYELAPSLRGPAAMLPKLVGQRTA